MRLPYGDTFWDRRYGEAAAEFVFGTAPNDFLASCAPVIPAGPVLCLAEGEGRNAVHLASRGHAVTAVDQSAVGLRKAQELAAAHGVELTTVVADLADFTIEPNAWAAVISIFCHLPQPLRREVHARAAAGLRPGGWLILEAYTPAQIAFKTGGPLGAPELLMKRDEVMAEFPQIQWQTAHEIERDVVEGSGHTGRAAVLQLCGSRST
jgi:SAM-dependent methyltransferase